MENIETFVNFCESYGVTRTGLFQTVDLFDGRNMTQVISCIQQLGSEVHVASQPHHFRSPSFLLSFYLGRLPKR